MWSFHQLNDSDKILGELHQRINNIITNSKANSESDVTLIKDGLWLGNWNISQDLNFLDKCNISAVINVSPIVGRNFKNIKYHTIPIKDSLACEKDIYHILECGADTIHDLINRGETILVNCKRGHHRSASIVAFYLMKYCGMTLVEAVAYIKIFVQLLLEE